MLKYGDEETVNAIRADQSLLRHNTQKRRQACQMAGKTTFIAKKHAIRMITLATHITK
jgi:hypothetical protein